MGTALEVSTAVLTLETGVAEGILRRAAVVCIGAVLNAVVREDEEDKEGEVWREEVWRVVVERGKEVGRCLGYVRYTDADGLVREQAGVVLENLEALRERRMVGGRGRWVDEPPAGVLGL